MLSYKTIMILRSCQWPDGYEVSEVSDSPAPWCRLRAINELIRQDRSLLKTWNCLREAIQIKYFVDVSIFGLRRTTIFGAIGEPYFEDFKSLFHAVDNIESVHSSLTLMENGVAHPYITLDVIHKDQKELEETVSKIGSFFSSFQETIPDHEWKWEFMRKKQEFRKLLSRDGTHLKRSAIRSLRDAAFERFAGIATSGSNVRRIERIAPDVLQAYRAGIIKIAPYVDTTLIKGYNSMVLTVSGDYNDRTQIENKLMSDEFLASHLVMFERIYSNVMIALLDVSKSSELNSLVERSTGLFPDRGLTHTLFLKNVFNETVYDSLLEREIVV